MPDSEDFSNRRAWPFVLRCGVLDSRVFQQFSAFSLTDCSVRRPSDSLRSYRVINEEPTLTVKPVWVHPLLFDCPADKRVALQATRTDT